MPFETMNFATKIYTSPRTVVGVFQEPFLKDCVGSFAVHVGNKVEGVPMELVRPSGFDIVSQLAIHSNSLWVKKFLKS